MAASCGSHDQKLLKSGRTKPEGPRPPHPMRRYSLNRSYCKSWVYAPVMDFTFLFYKITVRKARRRFITAGCAPQLSSVILSGVEGSFPPLSHSAHLSRRLDKSHFSAICLIPSPFFGHCALFSGRKSPENLPKIHFFPLEPFSDSW